ncbi:MAG: ABC transporter permease [Planctomycetota bacterium]
MMKKLLRSRGLKKLLRNRLALAAMFVIGLYSFIGIAVFFGAISDEETAQRVGPDSYPGYPHTATAEERLQHCDFYVSRIERVLSRDGNLEEAALALRPVREGSREELAADIEKAIALYDEITESQKNLNDSPEVLPKIAELEEIVDGLYTPGSGWKGFYHDFQLFFGTDRQGRSIILRGLYSIKVAIQVGVVVALIAVLFGSLLGAAAAFFGPWVDIPVIWLYSTFSSIPYLVLLTLLAFMFLGSTIETQYPLVPLYVAFCTTFWIGPCRVIRGEALKIKELEYVQAATAVGFGRFYILWKHILPNTSHLMFINFSLLFIGAIKAEVILTFLGLGIKEGASWGIMISQSKFEVVNGFFWQIGVATFLMMGLVLAFNILTDALQDAFDPKHV